MTAPPRCREVIRPLAVRANEAAAMLGISRSTFDRHVGPDLPFVRVGTAKLYSVAALEAWLVNARQAI